MDSKHDRREFLVRPVEWAAAAGLLSGVAPFAHRADARRGGCVQGPHADPRQDRHHACPWSAWGVMNADVPGLVKRAYEVGMRHYDTAAFYQGGRNEEMVGAMVKQMGGPRQGRNRDQGLSARQRSGRSTLPRPRLRFGAFSRAASNACRSTRSTSSTITPSDSAGEVRAEGPLEALAELKKEGKTRFVGVSTHRGAEVLPEAVRLGCFDIVLVTLNYTMANDKPLLDAIDQAAGAGIGVVAMKTQAGGLARPDPKLPKNLPPHSQTALLKWGSAQPRHHDGNSRLHHLRAVGAELHRRFEPRLHRRRKGLPGPTRPSPPAHNSAASVASAAPIAPPALTFPRSCALTCTPHSTPTTISPEPLWRPSPPATGLAACQSCSGCQATCRNQVDIGMKIAQLRASNLVLQA